MSAGTVPPAGSWTARLRARTLEAVPAEQALPDRQPAYVASWIYVFGVATLAALIVVVATGVVLAIAGSATSSTACTCGASRSSSRPWSCTCGASSGWRPGGVAAP